jgi:hypothetical protein
MAVKKKGLALGGRPTDVHRAGATCPLTTPWRVRKSGETYIIRDDEGTVICEVIPTANGKLDIDQVIRILVGAGVMYEQLMTARWLGFKKKFTTAWRCAKVALNKVHKIKVGDSVKKRVYRVYQPSEVAQ